MTFIGREPDGTEAEIAFYLIITSGMSLRFQLCFRQYPRLWTQRRNWFRKVMRRSPQEISTRGCVA